MPNVADCERVQTDGFRLPATTWGGSMWSDDGLLWTDGPDGMNVVRVRHAEARVAAARAGHAWSLHDGQLAGVFAMEVWPRFQRRGLGTALLSTVCAAARSAGAPAERRRSRGSRGFRMDACPGR